VLRDVIELHDHGEVMPSAAVVSWRWSSLAQVRADLSHMLGIRGRSPCVRQTSWLWQPRRRMLIFGSGTTA